jgi:hypothetical protein
MAAAVGVIGIAFTVTATVPAALLQPRIVVVTEYVPLLVSVAFVILGFCVEDEKLAGPVQE